MDKYKADVDGDEVEGLEAAVNSSGQDDSSVAELILNSTNEMGEIGSCPDMNADVTPAPKAKWSRMQKLQVVGILVALLMSIAGYALISPFFPIEAKKKGLGETKTGIIFASFQVSMFIMSPIYGYLVSLYSLLFTLPLCLSADVNYINNVTSAVTVTQTAGCEYVNS